MTTIYTLHSHNQRSKHLFYLIEACESHGLEILERAYLQSDGSISLEYGIDSNELEFFGGLKRMLEMAYALQFS